MLGTFQLVTATSICARSLSNKASLWTIWELAMKEQSCKVLLHKNIRSMFLVKYISYIYIYITKFNTFVLQRSHGLISIERAYNPC